MTVFSRFASTGLLFVAVACGGPDDSAPDPDVQTDAPGAALPEPTYVDSAAELPAGLAPVAVDDAERQTADRATGGPSSSGAQPRGGSAQPSGGTSQPDGRSPAPVRPAGDSPVQEDEGAAVLRRAATANENVRYMQAEFVMQFNNPLLRQQTTSRGTLYQQRPDRIALRFTDPNGDVILSDGQHFYMFQPSIDANQATRTPAGAGAGGGVDLQAQFVGNPTERFRYTLEGNESVAGRSARVMTLVPRERAEYRSLKVWFDARDSLARRFEITELNGSVRRFDLSDLRVNPSIPADVFRFTAPPGVRIVNVG
jgi:outer membrane lipoprotein-sorting protein